MFSKRRFYRIAAVLTILTPVCTENLIRVDEVMESPRLAE